MTNGNATDGSERLSVEDVVDHEGNCAACGVHDRVEDSRYCAGCRDALVRADGGANPSVDRRWRIISGNWAEKAQKNVDQWGVQEVDTLLLAMQEEMGELTQAHLEARSEGGDSGRVGEELADLAALCFQLHWRLSNETTSTDR